MNAAVADIPIPRAVAAPARERILVVIPARDADRTLPRCLASLARARRLNAFNVLVVRDGEALQGLAESADGLVLREVVSNRIGNAGAARNFGAQFLNDGILVFLDADVLVEDDALERLVAPILRAEADATVGNYSEDVRGLHFAQAYKQLYLSMVYGRRAGLIRNEFWTALGAIRASAFRAVGGFSGRFPGARGEDTDLGQRLTLAGFRIWAVPEAKSRHLHPFTCCGLVRNDLQKGAQILLNNFRNRNSLADNRHTTRADVQAVVLAYFSLAGLIAGAFVAPAALAGAAAFTAWLAARHELLNFLRRQGPFFLLRSIPVALSLDLVRGLCIPLALARFWFEPAEPL